jgi:hypothetical protein
MASTMRAGRVISVANARKVLPQVLPQMRRRSRAGEGHEAPASRPALRLPEREREAVRALERHVASRSTVSEHDPVELDEDGRPTKFLAIGHVVRCLKACGATRTGQKFAVQWAFHNTGPP